MTMWAAGAAVVGAGISAYGASQSGGETKTEPWKPIQPFIIGRGDTPQHIAGNPLINDNWLQYVQSIGGGDWNSPWQPMTGNSPWFNEDQRFTPEGEAPQWQPFGGYAPNVGGPYTNNQQPMPGQQPGQPMQPDSPYGSLPPEPEAPPELSFAERVNAWYENASPGEGGYRRVTDYMGQQGDNFDNFANNWYQGNQDSDFARRIMGMSQSEQPGGGMPPDLGALNWLNGSV